MLPGGPRGGQEQRNPWGLHCFQQEKPGAVAVPAGEGSGWGGPAPQNPSGWAMPGWSSSVTITVLLDRGSEQPCG